MEKPVNAKKTTLTILKYLAKPLLFMVRKPPRCGDSTKPKTAHKRKTCGFEPQEPSTSSKVTCMGQIKRRMKAAKQRKFNGGRDALRCFGWTAVRPSDLSEDQEKMAVTQFAPVLVVTKKEINLWKRRSMPPPAPLLIN